MIFLTKSKCTDGETDAQTGPSEARWLFAGGVKKGKMLLTFSHTITPFDGSGKQAF